jgi:hypothetical protein
VHRNHTGHKTNWITKGIKTSCSIKRDLYIKYRNTNNPPKKDYYKKYCTILKKVIKEAKKLYYNTLIKTSANKTKTTWNIIRENTGKIQDLNGTSERNLENEIVEDSRETAYAFNKYFLSTVEKLSLNHSNQSMSVTIKKIYVPSSRVTLLNDAIAAEI